MHGGFAEVYPSNIRGENDFVLFYLLVGLGAL